MRNNSFLRAAFLLGCLAGFLSVTSGAALGVTYSYNSIDFGEPGGHAVTRYVPKIIYFADEGGSRISKPIIITGGTSPTTLRVKVDDKDGVPGVGAGDYTSRVIHKAVISVSCDIAATSKPTLAELQAQYPAEFDAMYKDYLAKALDLNNQYGFHYAHPTPGGDAASEIDAVLGGDWKGDKPEIMALYPEDLGSVIVSAANSGGDDSETGYEEKFATVSLTFAYGPENYNYLEVPWPRASVSVTIRPHDGSGENGDNGGGSCGVGLGGALLLSCMALLRKWR